MKYSTQQLINRVQEIGGVIVPNKYLIIGVQEKDDNFNVMDDKFYVLLGGQMVIATTGTTNSGANALLNFDKAGLSGAAVWKTDEFYSDLYSYGLHKGKMPALRQVQPVKYYRDSDKDHKAEEQGQLYSEIRGFNFHGVDYDPDSKVVKTNIGGWSWGCQVVNNMRDYRIIIELIRRHPLKADYAILKEF